MHLSICLYHNCWTLDRLKSSFAAHHLELIQCVANVCVILFVCTLYIPFDVSTFFIDPQSLHLRLKVRGRVLSWEILDRFAHFLHYLTAVSRPEQIRAYFAAALSATYAQNTSSAT